LVFVSLSRGRKGGQASNEDLFPLGYGDRDRDRVRVRVNNKKYLNTYLFATI
jgi:hypothetical protein